MEREPVSSSMISSVGYDKDSETLEVEFNNGSVYRYGGVPVDEFESLVSAPSIGRHFLSFIKDQYPTELA